MGSSTLEDVVQRLFGPSVEELTIYVDADIPPSARTRAELRKYTYPSPPPPGMRVLLSVEDARDVLATWSRWRQGRAPTVAEAVRAIVHYAENDAYITTDMDVE